MKKKASRIGIDLRLWGHPGIGRYIRELVGALVSRRGSEELHFLAYLRDAKEFLNLTKRESVSLGPVRSKVYSLSEQWEMPLAARGLGLLHVPHFNIPVFYQGKLVVTVHDLTYLHDTKASKSRLGKPYAEFLFRQIQKKAAAIFTVSEYTRQDLLNFFPGIRPECVHVTHEAAAPMFRVIEEAKFLERSRQRYGASKPFVLFVGSLKDHKNIPVLVRAVELLRIEKKIDAELVIAGRRDPKCVELHSLLRSKEVFVKYLGEVPDEELAALYNLASVFVLPSLREGFGLPVLEAMACGTPVIVSNRTSLPEIAGNAGLLFDASRPEELTELLYKVLSDKRLTRELSLKGLARAAEFSWEKTAQKTWEVYDRVRG